MSLYLAVISDVKLVYILNKFRRQNVQGSDKLGGIKNRSNIVRHFDEGVLEADSEMELHDVT